MRRWTFCRCVMCCNFVRQSYCESSKSTYRRRGRVPLLGKRTGVSWCNPQGRILIRRGSSKKQPKTNFWLKSEPISGAEIWSLLKTGIKGHLNLFQIRAKVSREKNCGKLWDSFEVPETRFIHFSGSWPWNLRLLKETFKTFEVFGTFETFEKLETLRPLKLLRSMGFFETFETFETFGTFET